MSIEWPALPVKDIIPEFLSKLETCSNLVLVAPPGAGKTTLIPLALQNASWVKGKRILMLEPRRLAARSAAQRMASLLAEKVGEHVGYRVRFDTKVSSKTTIEVITEGVFCRLLSQDPGLEDVAAVIFDEFHERSLDGDLALALCLDLQQGLREDLRLIPMSATLDGAAIADLMGADVIESQGRAYPVTLSYYDRRPNTPLEEAVLHGVRDALNPTTNSNQITHKDILVFLPGQGEIERCHKRLSAKLGTNVEIHRLYGALPTKQQDAALAPSSTGMRKIILASAIAETSLTIENVTTVIDSGLSRQPVFEPATGLTRLQTVRASQASITQRAGRAGRLQAGHAIRLWREEQTKALPPHAPAEILNADLTALLLNLTDWGVQNVDHLQWLDSPPAPAIAEARHLLINLKALTKEGQLTDHGRNMGQLALPPRFAHMVLMASQYNKASAQRAALLALLIQERGVGGFSIDLTERCNKAGHENNKRSQHLMRMAESLAKQAHSFTRAQPQTSSQSLSDEALPDGVLLAMAYFDRIAQNRGTNPNGWTRFRLANGRGAQIESDQLLSQSSFLVISDMSGKAGAARILSAASLTRAELFEHFAPLIDNKTESHFDLKSGTLSAQQTTMLGALSLSKPQNIAIDPQEALTALLDAVKNHGIDCLPWQESDLKLRHRLALLHNFEPEQWPSMDHQNLAQTCDEWLSPYLAGQQSLACLSKGQLSDALLALANFPSPQLLDSLVPTHFHAPSGSHVPLRYEKQKVVLAIRPQELFGLDRHPAILKGHRPIEIELLSPAGRPIQITCDLPRFWRGSWADVRADLRGRYIKHPWPEDPLQAVPTQRIKPRKKN